MNGVLIYEKQKYGDVKGHDEIWGNIKEEAKRDTMEW